MHVFWLIDLIKDCLSNPIVLTEKNKEKKYRSEYFESFNVCVMIKNPLFIVISYSIIQLMNNIIVVYRSLIISYNKRMVLFLFSIRVILFFFKERRKYICVFKTLRINIIYKEKTNKHNIHKRVKSLPKDAEYSNFH